MTDLDRIEGWFMRSNGPGFWAADPDDRVSVWLQDDALHYETLHGGDECDIPLAVIRRLVELDRGAK